MNIITVQIMNITLGIMVSSYFELPEVSLSKDKTIETIFNFHSFHNYINRPLEIFGLLSWIVIVWRGTVEEKLFSKLTVVILLILSILIISAHIYGVYRIFLSEEDLTNEGFIVFLINLLNQVWVYAYYFALYFQYHYYRRRNEQEDA